MTLYDLLTKVLDGQKSMNDQILQFTKEMKARNDALDAKFELYWGKSSHLPIEGD